MVRLLDYLQDSICSEPEGYAGLKKKIIDFPLISSPLQAGQDFTTAAGRIDQAASRTVNLSNVRLMIDDAKNTPFFNVIKALHEFYVDKQREGSETSNSYSTHSATTVHNILKCDRKNACALRLISDIYFRFGIASSFGKGLSGFQGFKANPVRH